MHYKLRAAMPITEPGLTAISQLTWIEEDNTDLSIIRPKSLDKLIRQISFLYLH
jgi:hypothetical protein